MELIKKSPRRCDLVVATHNEDSIRTALTKYVAETFLRATYLRLIQSFVKGCRNLNWQNPTPGSISLSCSACTIKSRIRSVSRVRQNAFVNACFRDQEAQEMVYCGERRWEHQANQMQTAHDSFVTQSGRQTDFQSSYSNTGFPNLNYLLMFFLLLLFPCAGRSIG